jgi:hypothetical protein
VPSLTKTNTEAKMMTDDERREMEAVFDKFGFCREGSSNMWVKKEVVARRAAGIPMCPNCMEPSPGGRQCVKCQANDLQSRLYAHDDYYTEDMARAELILNHFGDLPEGLDPTDALEEARRIHDGEGATWSKDPAHPYSISWPEEFRREQGWA